ncbi:TetR/AcrR family transcriptional regulator [Paracoccus aerius]|uniref:TetR family transcriptional regulator n=1 Tax=Paracoccus aerius TaxID=1915382 RepID=A0ABS1S600_9RHOB|nr:TetR/AcrR family transcriptional regulator [Paracoccus aerius]MBL3673980.1 TetR family transcriptional regulator [Paracoccus aerius]GHG23483.1 TetR family transcriptional regulator [Paracoccus aerius]
MARPRKHDQQLILDAVARVIARDGILTLDAVATEAGVSKATVLYEHASKRELLAALVRRTIEADNGFNIRCSQGYDGEPDAALRGRIDAARRSAPPEGGDPAVLSLIAALMQDAELRAEFRANQAELREGLLQDAADRRRTRLAWLALEGLKFQQHMDLVPWSLEEVGEALDDIEALVAKKDKP